MSFIGQYGGVAIGLAVAILVATRFSAGREKRMAGEGGPGPEPARRPCLLTTLALIVCAILVSITLTLGYRWYDYVTNAPNPYDEIGIEVNSRLPDSLNAWGCGRLQARFPRAVPPYGCAHPGGRGWR